MNHKSHEKVACLEWVKSRPKTDESRRAGVLNGDGSRPEMGRLMISRTTIHYLCRNGTGRWENVIRNKIRQSWRKMTGSGKAGWMWLKMTGAGSDWKGGKDVGRSGREMPNTWGTAQIKQFWDEQFLNQRKEKYDFIVERVQGNWCFGCIACCGNFEFALILLIRIFQRISRNQSVDERCRAKRL